MGEHVETLQQYISLQTVNDKRCYSYFGQVLRVNKR